MKLLNLLEQGAVVGVAFVVLRFQRMQHLPQGICVGEQRGDHFRRRRQFAFAEEAQQVLPDLGDLLDFLQSQTAGSSLDGVDDAEDAVQGVRAARALFQCQELVVITIQAFKALDDQVIDQLLMKLVVHSGAGVATSWGAPWPRRRAIDRA